jgi:uncharacterized membrane protein
VAQLRHVVEIRRTVEDVFLLLGDPARDPEWAGPIVAVEPLTPGPVGVGTRFRQTSRTLGVRFPIQLEVVAHELNRRIELKSVGGAVDYRGERRFDSTANGTRVTFIGDVRLRAALRLLEPLAARFSGGRVDRDLQAVKRRLEATTG